jgi:hypothetical protein
MTFSNLIYARGFLVASDQGYFDIRMATEISENGIGIGASAGGEDR